MDIGVRAKHDSREGGGRAKQEARAEEARAEHATWQECYREVAFTDVSFSLTGSDLSKRLF
jgi:hypothetical protein